MLSMWKQAWREKDSPQDPTEDQLVEPEGGLSSSTVLHRDNGDVDPSTRPKKRLRIDANQALPLTDTLLQAVEQQNTAIILSQEQSIVTPLVQLLTRVVKSRRDHFGPINKGQTALLVVNDNDSFDTYESGVLPEDIDKCVIAGNNPKIESWDGFVQKDLVILSCDRLLQSLNHGTLTMSQLYMLMFSDVLTAQGQTMVSIRRIMEDFYLVTDCMSRPRIYSFATLPATSRESTMSILHELQLLLDSKILRLSNQELKETPSLLRCSHEVVLTYKAVAGQHVPTLLEKLKLIDPSELFCPKTFHISREVLGELGPCASDLVWRLAMKDFGASMLDQISTGSRRPKGEQAGSASLYRQVWDQIEKWTYALPDIDPSSHGYNISPKFSMLLGALESFAPYGDNFCGIIIVRGREIALAAADLLQNSNVKPGFLRPVAWLGVEHSSITLQNILHLFATGVYNLLVASELDQPVEIPRLTAFICFDRTAPATTIRQLNHSSQFHIIYIIEENRDLPWDNTERPTNSIEVPAYSICMSPELISSIGPWPKAELAATTSNYGHEFIQDPIAGGRIHKNNSTQVVHHIAAKGLVAGLTPGQPVFHFDEQPGGHGLPSTFTCTVILPGAVNKITGPSCTTKGEASSAACFKVCQIFWSLGLLDYRSFPRPVVDHLYDSPIEPPSDPKSAGTRQYPRKNPDFWANIRNSSTGCLFPMVISIPSASRDQPYAPLAILTKQPLPDILSFKVYFSGIPATVSIQRCAPLPLEGAQLSHLHLFTLRLIRAISNKPLECAFPDMVYFLAPLSKGWMTRKMEISDPPYGLPTIVDHVPWDLIRLAGDNYHLPLRMTTPEEAENDLKDAVIQDRSVEFTRKYYAIKVRQDLSPLSKPTDSTREQAYESILAFCKSRRKDFEGLQNEDQPLVEVATVPAIQNQLHPASRPPVLLKPPAKYLIPELCSKSVIPASTLRTALLLPSITQRIDDLLLVKELNAKLFNCAISDKLLHIALCTPSSGVEYNYERLELLGDAFLKYISSVYVFVAYPTHTEGFLHVARQELISNRSLFKLASRIRLPPYIRSRVFSAKQWQPPNFFPSLSTTAKDKNQFYGKATEASDVSHLPIVKNQAQEASSNIDAASSSSIEDLKPAVDPATEIKKSKSSLITLKKREPSRRKRKGKREAIQWLGDKAVADVAEAIIGAGYITGGQEIGLQVARALGIPLSNIHRWADFSNQLGLVAAVPSLSLGPESIKGIQDIIGYKVENPSLLSQALTHYSIPGHDKLVSERLEFVGDAILDFMVIRHIYEREQQLSPGWLTLLKGAMVSNSALAAICVCSGLYKHLLVDSHTLNVTIQEYVNSLKVSQEREYQNAATEGRSPGQFWLELAAPKVLSDVVESITGVLFVADQFSSTGVEALFAKLLKPFYDRHISLKTFAQHPTKLLFEIFQHQGCRQYTAETEAKEKKTNLSVVNVLVHDVVLASAEDPDLNIAARRASLFALDALEGDPGFFIRNCDCRVGSSNK